MQRLEEELNVKLFNRFGGKKKAELTELGKTLYPYFKDGFDSIQECVNICKKLSSTQEYIIACPYNMSQMILPMILKRLYKALPQTEFKLQIMTSKETIKNLQIGKVDIGFVHLDKFEPVHNLTLIPMIDVETLLVASLYHPLANKQFISIEDLQNEQIYSSIAITTNRFDEFLKHSGLLDYKIIKNNNPEWLKTKVVNGNNIAFLPRYMVQENLESKNLVELKLNEKLPTTPISLIYSETVPKQIKRILIESFRPVPPFTL